MAYHPAAATFSLILMASLGFLLTCIPPSRPWIIPQPKTKVWELLAKLLGQDHICLSTSDSGNLMSTCLVGIPSNSSKYPPSLLSHHDAVNRRTHRIAFRSPNQITVKTPVENPLVPWRDSVKGLPKLSNEPAYFDILGSSFATFCVQFVFTPKTQKELFISITQHNPKYKAATWCENIAHVKMPSTEDSALRQLPKGLFLLCGNRAWAGIPPSPSRRAVYFRAVDLVHTQHIPNY